MFRRTTALIASATLALCLAGTALAASTAWIRVINVKTDNVAAYVQQLETGRAMMKGSGSTRSCTSTGPPLPARAPAPSS